MSMFSGVSLGVVGKCGRNKRRDDRRLCEQMKCQFGEVCDVSKTGLRVRADKPSGVRPGKVVKLELKNNGARLVLDAKVAWVRRSTTGVTEIGFLFPGLNLGQCQALAELAGVGVDWGNRRWNSDAA